jgi:hypothetical protein
VYQPVVRIELGSWNPSGWEQVGKGVDSAKNHTEQEGSLVIWTDTSDETSAGAIEKPCSNMLAHTPDVCKGILSDQWVPGSLG